MPEDNQDQNPTFVTVEQLEEFQANIRETLFEELNKAVNGATSRSAQSLQNKLSKEIQGQFAPIIEALQGQSQAPDQPQTQQQTQAPEQPAATEDNDLAKSLSTFKDQLAQLQQQNRQLAEQLKTQQQETAAERLQRLQTQHQSKFYTTVGDKVTDPDAFLTVLTSKTGAQFDPDKGYVVKGQDEFGNETITPLTDITEQYLQGDLAYFAKPRPGNGTGATPSGQAPRQNQSLFQGENTNRDAIAKLARESVDPLAAITQELLKSAN